MQKKIKIRTVSAICSILASCGFHLTAAERMPEIFGSVVFADGWNTQQNAIGMYELPTSADMEFRQLSPAHIDASSGGVLIGDTYWATYFVDYLGTPFVMVQSYDVKTWEETSFRYGEPSVISTGVAYDPVNRLVYGCFRNDTNTGYVFGTIDYSTLKRTAIAPLETMWSAVAVDREGILYAIDEQGVLFTVDKSDGSMTRIGDTGLKASHPSSACIDYRSGRLFYAVTNAPDGSLYEIDKTTGTSSLIYHFPHNEEVVGMYIPIPDAEDGAPDAPASVELNFTGGSLSGTVGLTARETTFGGAQGSGRLEYRIEANDILLAEGDIDWGAALSVPVTLPDNGVYVFKIVLVNDCGSSPAIEKELFVGKDIPVAPGISMVSDNGLVTLTVTPSTETLNGGFADFERMEYRVMRHPDNLILTSSGNPYAFEDRIAPDGDLRAYWYSVEARYSDIVSDRTLTSKIWTGAATPPYESVFDSFEASEPYIVINGGNSAQTWRWDEEQNSFVIMFNREADNDDWLLTPALDLKAGLIYKARINLRTYLGNPEAVEIKCGDAPSAYAMKESLMPRTVIKCREAQEFVVYIKPEKDGVHYLGIHSVTPRDESWYTFVDSVIIEAGVSSDVPGQPDSMIITPDYDGALSAEIEITAPSKSSNGNPLTSIDRLELRRDGETVKTFQNPAPGEILKYTDRPAVNGYHVYDATAFNSSGEGTRIEKRVFVGVNSPSKPAWAAIEETDVPGKVKVSWAPVTVAADGTPMNPELIRYDLMTVDETHGGEAYTAAEGVRGDHCEIEVPNASKTQKFAYYAVKAITDYDYSLMTLTPFLPVGPAYEMPYRESFAGGVARTLIRPDNRDAMWSIYTDDSGIPANDGDRGMAAMFGELYGSDAWIYSGKIALRGADNPVLCFYTYNILGEDKDLNELEVYIGLGTEFKPVRSLVVSELGSADGWYPVFISLDGYKDMDIQIAFRGVTRNRKFTLIDNISVIDAKRMDLKAGLLSVPQSVSPGKEFTITVGVENIGLEKVDDYTVDLLENGQVIENRNGSSLNPGKTEIITFERVLNPSAGTSVKYSFRVNWYSEGHSENNLSKEIEVSVDYPLVPSPENLSGKAEEDGTHIKWDAPDLSSIAPTYFIEDFESWTSWTKNGENGWVFVDRDESGIGALQNIMLPGIDYNSNLAWFLMDATYSSLGDDFSAASGNKYLSTFFCLPKGDFQYVANDDWAISPRLYGGAQTIWLTARSVNPEEAEESFEILYTDRDSTDPNDYISVEKVAKVPGTWTEYSFRLPAGAKRFAIRYDKTYGLMLHVDDVSYVPEGRSDVTLKGYNVYRDGTLVTKKPISATEYSDATVCREDVVYGVSAVYSDNSESACSFITLNVNNSGVGVSTSDTLTVRVSDGVVSIAGAEGRDVVVCDMTGRIVLNKRCDEFVQFPLSSGIYILTVGNNSTKIVIR